MAMILGVYASDGIPRNDEDEERIISALDLVRDSFLLKGLVHSKLKSADSICTKWAHAWTADVIHIPADTVTFGSLAYRISKQELVNASDIIVVFWDGQCVDTEEFLDLATRHRKLVAYYLFGTLVTVPVHARNVV